MSIFRSRGRTSYSDVARNSPTPSFVTEEPKPKPEAVESEEPKPAKSFLKDFVDKIPTPIQDAVAEKFGGVVGMVEK